MGYVLEKSLAYNNFHEFKN